MAGYTITQSVIYKLNGAILVNTELEYPGDNVRNFNTSIGPTVTNSQINISLPVTGIQSLILWASGNLTLKTNSSSMPQETIPLVADKPLMWDVDSPAGDIPFAGPVTALFLTNTSSTSSVEFLLSILYEL